MHVEKMIPGEENGAGQLQGDRIEGEERARKSENGAVALTVESFMDALVLKPSSTAVSTS